MKMTAKDFFLYLGALVTLYVSAGSVIALLFAIINHLVADPVLDYYGGTYTGGIQFAIAALIIIFPIYLIVSWLIRKDITLFPDKADFWIRKWFIGLTLFAAGALLAGDLVALVYAFLGGELTTRFALKALVIAVVALAVFGYYLYDIKRVQKGNKEVNTVLVGALVLIMLVILGAGFGVLGSPSHQRDLRIDAERVYALQDIQWQTVQYWQSKGRLPVMLTDLQDDFSYFAVPTDPVTGEMYEYRVIGDTTFEICAEFDAASDDRRLNNSRSYGIRDGGWEHEAGVTCFERTIDEDMYPVRETLPL